MTDKKTQKPNPERDRKKERKGTPIIGGGTKYTPEELRELVARFIKFAMDDKNKTACTRANFIMFIFKEYGYFIGEQTLLNYQKKPEFDGIVQSLTLAQRAQLENRSLYAVMGQGSVMALMLKNVGYQDKIVTEVVDDTLFEAIDPTRVNLKPDEGVNEQDIPIDISGGK